MIKNKIQYIVLKHFRSLFLVWGSYLTRYYEWESSIYRFIQMNRLNCRVTTIKDKFMRHLFYNGDQKEG